MATLDMHRSPRCQHVHYSGRPCKAPARRGRNYCVFHQAAHLDPGGCVLPIVEDLHSYHLAVIRIARALADDVIDSRKATALLYAMQLVGSKIEAFAKERRTIEDPVASLKQEISERYDARKHPFPAYILEKDLLPILKQILSEHAPERNENIEPIPTEANQQSRIENQNSPAPTAKSPEPCALSPAPDSEVREQRLASGPARTDVPQGPTENSPAPTPETPQPEPPTTSDGRLATDLHPPPADSGGGSGISATGAA